jgi:hypothetical protein
MIASHYVPARDDQPLGVVGQTLAVLHDAYRQLAASRIFWITLALSALVSSVFAFVSINERGIVAFGFEIPGAWNSNVIEPRSFYKFLFVNLAIPWWLGVFASALALISVAGIFPDLLAGGAVELYVSKPLSRWRLFFTKYVGGLLFVAAQVLLFSVVAFIVIGTRGGTWEWGIFLAVPVVTLFFSYLFSVCALLGMWTRSTLASLLLTVLFWGALFLLGLADDGLLTFTVAAEDRLQRHQLLISQNEAMIARNDTLPEQDRSDVTQFRFQLERQRELESRYRADVEELRFWHGVVGMVRLPLPKSAETLRLLDRWLIPPDALDLARQSVEERREQRRRERGASARPDARLDPGASRVVREVERRMDARSLTWVVGTSLGFELAVLLLAGWMFARRDF